MIRTILPNSSRFVFLIISVIGWCGSKAQTQLTNTIDLLQKTTSVPSVLPVDYIPTTNSTTSTANSCITSTFYLRITASAGEKINIKEIQTLANGNYLVTGNIILPNLEQEGILCILNNSGSIILQQRFRINNQSTTFYAAKALYNGSITVAGSTHGGTDNIFVINLNNNLTINWN